MGEQILTGTLEQISRQFHYWLAEAVRVGASDLHLVTHHPPVLRIHGDLQHMDEELLDEHALQHILTETCPSNLLTQFQKRKNVDYSLTQVIDEQPRRFRANFFFCGGHPGACFRVIPYEIPDFEWAGFPVEIAQELAHQRNGLVLVSGVAGSGKTTSLAMILNLLNLEGGHRIITVEEPVEYLFPRVRNSVVTQREVGEDVDNFSDGLKYGLRQDPDVILVGEIRDRETAQMALSAAETGHLVFSTLHTRDAKGAISRYVDLFSKDTQGEVRAQLALSLRAVISQHLLPSSQAGQKRELALEIMFNTSPIRSAIRFGKLESIDNCILTGRSDGMLPLDESVRRLYDDHRISKQVARQFVSDERKIV